jgi:hypothetical protein
MKYNNKMGPYIFMVEKRSSSQSLPRLALTTGLTNVAEQRQKQDPYHVQGFTLVGQSYEEHKTGT